MKILAQAGVRGFAFRELLCALLVLGLIALAAVPRLYKEREKARRFSCVGRLKNIGLSFRIWATDNSNLYPMQKLTNLTASAANLVPLYLQISNELSTAIILTCPADRERKGVRDFGQFTGKQLSYFLNYDAAEDKPQDFLAGDRNLEGVTETNSVMVLSRTDTNIAWSSKIHRFQGNFAMGDGSVQQNGITGLRDHVEKMSGQQRLLIPE